jgi:Ca-activated chloride channel homolog
MFNTVNDEWAWLSSEWFSPDTFLNISWENPNILYLLAIIPLIFLLRRFFIIKWGQKLPIALKKGDIKKTPVSLLRFIPDVVLSLAIALIVVSLARPQKTNEKVEQWTEGIDIMLVLDISESMMIEDFTPNRLESAKKMAIDFISGRFQDRIGMVIFSGEAFSLSPLTLDYNLLNSHIEEIRYDMITTPGTAIGSAIAVGTNRMRESESKSKVMILLSDGDNNAGNIDPIVAARLADAYDIKIYTIAIGKEGKVPYGKDFFGRPRFVENTLDETTLRKIAEIGKGRFYRVSNEKALEEVFHLIDQYEKVEIKENRFKNTTDYYRIYLTWAVVFFILWLFLKSTFLTNPLQD